LCYQISDFKSQGTRTVLLHRGKKFTNSTFVDLFDYANGNWDTVLARSGLKPPTPPLGMDGNLCLGRQAKTGQVQVRAKGPGREWYWAFQ